jgi:hypothetical protein
MSECDLTLLPSDYCAHCTNTPAVAEEPVFEKSDYVRTLNDIERQVIPNPAQFTDSVDMKDIYGTHIATRLRRK